MNNEKVAAIIVTYNRKDLLMKNVNACLRQSRKPDGIFVIDNASTDGTDVLFQDPAILADGTITYRRLPANIGGAGGFYEGMKQAFDEGYDLFWMMDDDGCPDLTCLEILLERGKHLDVCGPLIYCEQPGRTHSSFYVDGKKYDDVDELQNHAFATPVHPFNGTLLKREVVAKVGFPKKELFIWGDEQEYRLRWLKAGFKEASVMSALYFHPFNRLQFKKHGIFKLPDIKTNRKYLYFRNQSWIFLRYRNPLFAAASIGYMFFSILFFESDRAKALHGLSDGIRGDLSNPRVQ